MSEYYQQSETNKDDMQLFEYAIDVCNFECTDGCKWIAFDFEVK
jgi:hypothetical protein